MEEITCGFGDFILLRWQCFQNSPTDLVQSFIESQLAFADSKIHVETQQIQRSKTCLENEEQ